jgi:predicted nucleotidyltransferase
MGKQKNEQQDRLLLLFASKLRNRLGDHLKKIILYGSRARGDNLPDSDYDCIAILDVVSSTSVDAIDEIAGEFLYNYNVIFSILPITQSRLRQEVYNPLFMNIRKEGVSV